MWFQTINQYCLRRQVFWFWWDSYKGVTRGQVDALRTYGIIILTKHLCSLGFDRFKPRLKFFKFHLFVYIVKQNEKIRRFLQKNFVDFQNFLKFNEDRILMRDKYLKLWSFINLPWGPCPTKKLGPIGSAVLSFYWIQTDRQTNKQTNNLTSQIYI